MQFESDWQTIETAPQDGTAILVFHPAWDTCQVGMRYEETRVWQQPNGDVLKLPTHWMPLPTLPPSLGQDRHARE